MTCTPGGSTFTRMVPGHSEQVGLAVSVTEAARLVGIGRSLAYRLVASGEIPSHRFGSRVVVPVDRLRARLAGRNESEGGVLSGDQS